MKFRKSFLSILAAGVTLLTATPTFSQSNPSNSLGFRCTQNQDKWTTVVYNLKTDKELSLIHWDKTYIDSQDIKKDCSGAAEKFQKRYTSNQKLDLPAIQHDSYFLAIGNNSKDKIAVCLIQERGDSCNLRSSDELFHLKPQVKDQDLDGIFSQIINSKYLGKVDVSPTRSLTRIYPRIPSRTWWQILLN